MKTIFYCSYDFSAYGFQFVSADFENGTTNRVMRGNGIPDDIYMYFTRAGVSALAGISNERKGFFLVKGIKHFDESKKEGEQGYTQHYNLVFIAGVQHSDWDVFTLAAFALGNYQQFVSAMASIFIVKPELHEGYTVDVAKLKEYIHQAISKNVGNSRFARMLAPSLNRFRFAILNEDWAYALNMYNMPQHTPKPDITLSQDEFKRLVEEQNKVVPQPQPPQSPKPLQEEAPMPKPAPEISAVEMNQLLEDCKRENQTLKERIENQQRTIKSYKDPFIIQNVEDVKRLIQQPVVIGLIVIGFLIGLCFGLLF